VAVLTLIKTTYRLGETVLGVVTFNSPMSERRVLKVGPAGLGLASMRTELTVVAALRIPRIARVDPRELPTSIRVDFRSKSSTPVGSAPRGTSLGVCHTYLPPRFQLGYPLGRDPRVLPCGGSRWVQGRAGVAREIGISRLCAAEETASEESERWYQRWRRCQRCARWCIGQNRASRFEGE
jgi:hypothetical protein